MAFQFPGSFQDLIHNRPAMIGLAGAGGVGLFVWYRHRKTGGNAGDVADSARAGNISSGYGGGMGGTLDSSATDLASYLGDFSAGLNNQLADWLKQLQATTTVPPPESTPSPSGGPAITPGTRPFGGTPARPYFDVTAKSNVDGWVTALQRHGVHVVWSQIAALNPGIANNISNPKGASGPHGLNTFVKPGRYYLPPQSAWYS